MEKLNYKILPGSVALCRGIELKGYAPMESLQSPSPAREEKKIKIQVPVTLFVLFVLGTLAGAGFFLKNLTLEYQLAGLTRENDRLAELQMSNEWLKNRVAVLQEEKALLLDNAVADLHEKSRIIEAMLSSVGVDVEIRESSENSGGPFTSTALDSRDELILRAEKYLDTLQNIPLGAPVPGEFTSGFGRRRDPLNGRPAYHQGVDIRGSMGSEVRSTAGGSVIRQNYDRGNGRYILLDHGNGFRTKYAHLKKSLVQQGDIISRGQVIGLVGSSGRSTGPHVHYEIHYDDRIVNPTRFVRIAGYLDRENRR